MSRRTVIDLRFGPRLRELRQAQELSLRDLARQAYVGKSTLSELESGTKRPSLEMARHLDHALNADGELTGMVTESATSDESAERIQHALATPGRLDRAAVEALADVLAAQRRLDDVLSAEVLLPGAEPQWASVQRLAQCARGPHAGELRQVVAEWTQFLGWLHAEGRHDARAVQVLTEAAEQARAVEDGALLAQVENFRGYLERQRGNPRGIVRHFLAAYQTPGASVLQRIGDAVQAAHGLALLGDRREAERLLAEASDLTETVEGAEPPRAAYWLSPTFHRLAIGLALLGLGERARAADNLRAGLAGLPPEFSAAEWAAEYRQALSAADSEPLPS